MHMHTKAAVPNILKREQFLAEDFFERTNGRPPRLSLALLQLVNGPLRQSDTKAEFALAPAKDRPRHPYLGGKSPPLQPNEFDQTARAMYGKL